MLAMEFIAGGTLRDRIERRLAPAHAIEIVTTLAHALSHAHRYGIVHRDIKPANILFRDDNVPVLSDFGIALPMGDGTRLTQTGLTLGSPLYMSPEQVLGQPLDQRSDLYSLGIVFYESLVGEAPWSDTGNPFAAAMCHCTAPIPRLPPACAHYQPILEKMLAKRPEDRYQSAASLIHDLTSGAPNGNGTRLLPQVRTGSGPSPADRPARRERSRGSFAVATGSLVAATMLGLAVYFRPGRSTDAPAVADVAPAVIADPAPAAAKPNQAVAEDMLAASVPSTQTRAGDAALLSAPNGAAEHHSELDTPAAAAASAPVSSAAPVTMSEQAVARGETHASRPLDFVPSVQAPEKPTPMRETRIAGAVQVEGNRLAEPTTVAKSNPTAKPPSNETGLPQSVDEPEEETGAPILSAEVEEWLARADEALSAKRLLTPAGDSAVMWAERVLAIDATNGRALGVIDRVIDIYLGWADSQIARRDNARARSYLAKAHSLIDYASQQQREGLDALQGRLGTTSGTTSRTTNVTHKDTTTRTAGNTTRTSKPTRKTKTAAKRAEKKEGSGLLGGVKRTLRRVDCTIQRIANPDYCK